MSTVMYPKTFATLRDLPDVFAIYVCPTKAVYIVEGTEKGFSYAVGEVDFSEIGMTYSILADRKVARLDRRKLWSLLKEVVTFSLHQQRLPYEVQLTDQEGRNVSVFLKQPSLFY